MATNKKPQSDNKRPKKLPKSKELKNTTDLQKSVGGMSAACKHQTYLGGACASQGTCVQHASCVC